MGGGAPGLGGTPHLPKEYTDGWLSSQTRPDSQPSLGKEGPLHTHQVWAAPGHTLLGTSAAPCPQSRGAPLLYTWRPQRAWLCLLAPRSGSGEASPLGRSCRKGWRREAAPLTTRLRTDGRAGNWAQLAGWDQPNTGFCRAGLHIQAQEVGLPG